MDIVMGNFTSAVRVRENRVPAKDGEGGGGHAVRRLRKQRRPAAVRLVPVLEGPTRAPIPLPAAAVMTATPW